jgi:hypothetical protein
MLADFFSILPVIVAGLALVVAAYYGIIKKVMDYWREASTDSKTGAVSTKRAVYIHSVAASWAAVFAVLWKAKFVFTPESLEAFRVVVYSTAGAYTLGKGLELAGLKLGPKPPVDTAPAPEGGQS